MSKGSDMARTEIEAILEDQARAWAAGDAAEFSAHVAVDVVFTNIVGMFIVGRAEFQQQHDRIFTSFYKGSVMTQSVERITFVRPDVAIVDTLTQVEGGGPFPPGFPHAGRVVRTRLEQVMTREADGWRVAAFHNVAIPPSPGS